jgi:hypothetical protein
MWMCNPKILCSRHLLGEHLECHMFVGAIKKKTSLVGYVKNNLLEIKSLIERHKQLANEIKNHKSPLSEFDFSYLRSSIIDYKINKDKALNDLLNRCPKCKEKFLKMGV